MNDNTFLTVYHAYQRLIYWSVLVRTQNEELANDICQQTFLRYFEYLHTVEPGFEKGWLLSVSKNLLTDYYRRKKRLSVDEAQISEACQEKCYKADPAKEFAAKYFLSQILYELEQKNKDWVGTVSGLYLESARKGRGRRIEYFHRSAAYADLSWQTVPEEAVW